MDPDDAFLDPGGGGLHLGPAVVLALQTAQLVDVDEGEEHPEEQHGGHHVEQAAGPETPGSGEPARGGIHGRAL